MSTDHRHDQRFHSRSSSPYLPGDIIVRFFLLASKRPTSSYRWMFRTCVICFYTCTSRRLMSLSSLRRLLVCAIVCRMHRSTARQARRHTRETERGEKRSSTFHVNNCQNESAMHISWRFLLAMTYHSSIEREINESRLLLLVLRPSKASNERCALSNRQRNDEDVNHLFIEDDKIYFTPERICPFEMSMTHAYACVSFPPT